MTNVEIEALSRKRSIFMASCDALGIDPVMSQILFLIHMEFINPGNFDEIRKAHHLLMTDSNVPKAEQESNMKAEELTLTALDLHNLLLYDDSKKTTKTQMRNT